MEAFPLGQIVATPAALHALEQAGQSALEFIGRHARGDWGEASRPDAQANDTAVRDGGRLLSVYRTRTGQTLWVITEATDDQGRRAATTLLPEDY